MTTRGSRPGGRQPAGSLLLHTVGSGGMLRNLQRRIDLANDWFENDLDAVRVYRLLIAQSGEESPEAAAEWQVNIDVLVQRMVGHLQEIDFCQEQIDWLKTQPIPDLMD